MKTVLFQQKTACFLREDTSNRHMRLPVLVAAIHFCFTRVVNYG